MEVYSFGQLLRDNTAQGTSNKQVEDLSAVTDTSLYHPLYHHYVILFFTPKQNYDIYYAQGIGSKLS